MKPMGNKSVFLNRVRRCGVIVSTVCLLAMASGCGDGRPERASVSGKVLVDGKPLSKGNITFVPEGGRPSVARIQPDGSFELSCFDDDDGAIIGTHQVAISAKDIISEDNIKWHAPPKYSDYRNSGLTVEVTEPTDDLVIELTWEGEKKSRGRR